MKNIIWGNFKGTFKRHFQEILRELSKNCRIFLKLKRNFRKIISDYKEILEKLDKFSRKETDFGGASGMLYGNL